MIQTMIMISHAQKSKHSTQKTEISQPSPPKHLPLPNQECIYQLTYIEDLSGFEKFTGLHTLGLKESYIMHLPADLH